MNSIECVRDLVSPGSLRLGRPRRAGGLKLRPIFHKGAPADYLSFTEAHRRDLAVVTESGPTGEVPLLLVTNRAPLPVLLAEGEILLGLKQERVLNLSVLVPAGMRLEVPVSCVEAGRWRVTSAVSSGLATYNLSPSIRSAKTRSVVGSMKNGEGFRSDQAEVWQMVESRLKAFSLNSATASHADIGRHRSTDIERALHGLKPIAGQQGVMAEIAGGVCLEIFDRPETLASAWRRVVGSYVAEAIVAPRCECSLTVAELRSWMQRLVAVEVRDSPSVGMGETVAAQGDDGTYSALVSDGTVVHLAAFASSAEAQT